MTGAERQKDSGKNRSGERARPAYEEVADRLRAQIGEGGLSPGDRLPAEASLAADRGVSRSTIREALRVLNSEGLIRTERGVSGGSFVVETEAKSTAEFLQTRLAILSRQEAITTTELLETRGLLEAAGAALAAERRSDGDLEQLRAALELERDFHTTLLGAAQNRLLEALAAPLVQLLQGDGAAAADAGAANTEHEQILERIEAGDSAGAAAAMERHLGRLAEDYRRERPSPSTA